MPASATHRKKIICEYWMISAHLVESLRIAKAAQSDGIMDRRKKLFRELHQI